MNTTAHDMIEYKKIRLELRHEWTIARGSAGYKENIFVFYNRDGITGFGEAAHMTGTQQGPDRTINEINQLIPLYEEINPFQFFDLPGKAATILPGLCPAKAALEIALMDWIGKKLKLPLYKLLGLDSSKKIPTSFSIGIDTPEAMANKLEEASPFKILKVKLGGNNDRESIKALRKISDKPVRVDANEAWQDKEKAIKEIDWLAKKDVELVEQPMPACMLEETRWLKERSSLPLVADEAVNTSVDIHGIAEAYDGINIKLMKSGGIVEAFRMAVVAASLDLDTMLGCMIESSVAISAAAQLQPLARWIDLDGNLLLKDDPFEGVKLEDGCLLLAEAPGIGVKPRKNNYQL